MFVKIKYFMFVKNKTLSSCKYNIILFNKNNIIRRLAFVKKEKLHICENETLRSCKYNIILLVIRIIYLQIPMIVFSQP